MKKSEVEEFIARVVPEKDMLCLVTFKPYKEMLNIDGYTNILTKRGHRWKKVGCVITLNRKTFSTNNIAKQQAIVLHEIGHYFTRSCRDSVREFKAQQWAIQQAQEMELYDVVSTLKEDLNSWVNCGWNSKNRRYKSAYNIAKENKMI